MTSLLGGDFPFEFLHNEMVGHFFAGASTSDSTGPDSNAASDNQELCSLAATKLEYMGYRVGHALVERISKELPRFCTELDCLKFICKEFWTSVFRKQVDNLKTNHQGVYVVQDNKFSLVAPFADSPEYVDISARYLAYSCGLIRGALTGLGVQCVVTAAVDTLPAVKFNVRNTKS